MLVIRLRELGISIDQDTASRRNKISLKIIKSFNSLDTEKTKWRRRLKEEIFFQDFLILLKRLLQNYQKIKNQEDIILQYCDIFQSRCVSNRERVKEDMSYCWVKRRNWIAIDNVTCQWCDTRTVHEGRHKNNTLENKKILTFRQKQGQSHQWNVLKLLPDFQTKDESPSCKVQRQTGGH